MPVHNRTVGVDWAFDDLIIVFQVDDDDLRFIPFIELLPDANELIGF